MNRRVWLVSLACAGLAVVAGAAGVTPALHEPPKLKIAVIPKGTTHVFWKAVEKGAKKAGEDLKVEIVWKGPLKESDRAQQIQLVQQFTSQAGEGGISGIVLAPLDDKALVEPVKAAREKNVPVVIFDSALEGEAGKDFVSFVATDSAAAGKLGGEHLVKLLGGKGDAVVLRYIVGSASTEAREKGCIEAMKKGGLTVSSDNRYAGPTAGEAQSQALNMIDTIKKAQGVFCPNESSTMGMLLALRQTGLVGKVKFVGFDASPPLVAALKKGEIDALVVQDPQKMGYKAVEALVHHLRGQKVESTIDTGAVLVTQENMDKPEVKKLLE
jgi:ribose transport system substrate-binding protein